jgi:acyl-coenzyme A thioesterase PaaI-like protein
MGSKAASSTVAPPAVGESLRTRLMRLGFNLFPAYRASGARISHISGDLREVRVRLPLRRRTRNYVGTIFGGSMYSAVDPIYMVMLLKNLGPGYVVWDKAATIRFEKAGRSTLYARFVLSGGELEAIKSTLKTRRSVEREYRVELTDEKGIVHATVDKIVYVRRKDESKGEIG